MKNVKNNVKRARVLDLLNNGANPSNIAQDLRTSLVAVYRLIQRMKKDGLLSSDNQLTEAGNNHVKKYLAISSDVKFNIKQNVIRLHNVQVTINILNKPQNYDYRKNNIIKFKVKNYKTTNLKYNWKEEFVMNEVKVKTNINSIEIFPNDIYAETQQHAAKRLMDIIFSIISKLENLHKITLIKDGYCNIRISRQHYALVRNQLAKFYRNEQKGNTFRIFDEVDGKARLTMDISKGPEFEAEHPSKSPADIDKCQVWFKDLINKETDLPSDTRSMITGLAEISRNMMQRQQQSLLIEQDYAKNIKIHLKVLKGMDSSFKKFNSLLSQKKLKDWN